VILLKVGAGNVGREMSHSENAARAFTKVNHFTAWKARHGGHALRPTARNHLFWQA
jgi:hypothetical protein